MRTTDSLEKLDETGMKRGKEHISNAEIEVMIRKFIEDTAIVSKMQEENRGLKKKIDALMQNNMKFAELVQKLEQRNNRIQVQREKELLYSFQDGDMVKNEKPNKHRLRLEKKKLTLNEINSQLAEILTKLEKDEE